MRSHSRLYRLNISRLVDNSIYSLRWRPTLTQLHVMEVKARRPRLVLGRVTTREDWALWTWFRSVTYVTNRLYSRYRVDTDVKGIKSNKKAAPCTYWDTPKVLEWRLQRMFNCYCARLAAQAHGRLLDNQPMARLHQQSSHTYSYLCRTWNQAASLTWW